jgi:hypothetical protein
MGGEAKEGRGSEMRDSMWLVEIVPRNQAYSESRAVNELLMGDRLIFNWRAG